MGAVRTQAIAHLRRRRLQAIVIGSVLLAASAAATIALDTLIESQAPYDNAFAQCMYSKGDMVPGYGPMMVNAPPPPPPGPDTSLTYAVQTQLIRLGYMRPPADGVSGPRTSSAISQYESVSGLPVDGFPSPPLLARLQATP